MGGRYEILALLGSGAMGAVYLAEHDRIGRRDAIKILDRELADDESARARFNREARNASFINHPNVCTVYDFGETREGLPYIAMEYVDGETLTEVLEREGPLSPERAAELAAQVTRALEAAHARDIVHRDLKPDNVMLARDARGSEVVKVVDFGIAKAMAAEDDVRQDITRQGLLVGTPQYASPEQLEGKDLDDRSDLYSLGVVLFRVLTGRLPFTGQTWQEVMTKRLSEDPLTLEEAAPDRRFPADLERVVARALRRRPDERYQEAAEFREELLRAVEPTPGGRGTADRGDPDRGVPTEELPATGVGAAADTSAGTARGLPDVAWRPVALALLGVVVAAGLTFGGLRLAGDGGGASGDGADAGDRTTVATAGEADSSESRQGGAEAATGTSPDTAGTSRDTSSAAGGGAGATQEDGGDGADAGTAVAGQGTEAEGIAPEEVEATLMRQFDALAPPVPGPGRLRAIEDTGRAVWSMEGAADDRRAFAAHIVGVAHLGRGDTLDACPWLERAVRLDPDGEGFRARLEAVPACGESR